MRGLINVKTIVPFQAREARRPRQRFNPENLPLTALHPPRGFTPRTWVPSFPYLPHDANSFRKEQTAYMSRGSSHKLKSFTQRSSSNRVEHDQRWLILNNIKQNASAHRIHVAQPSSHSTTHRHHRTVSNIIILEATPSPTLCSIPNPPLLLRTPTMLR